MIAERLRVGNDIEQKLILLKVDLITGDTVTVPLPQDALASFIKGLKEASTNIDEAIGKNSTLH
jgi:hypothetical protein